MTIPDRNTATSKAQQHMSFTARAKMTVTYREINYRQDEDWKPSKKAKGRIAPTKRVRQKS